MIAQAAFWCSVALVFYAYFGYPMALAMISLFRNRPVAKRKITPRVSFIITAHNEEGRIRDKIDNTLAQDYPSQALEVIVASDCSSDRTDDIVSAYSPRVRLTRAAERRGKEAAQQIALESASGEIVIFSDVATALAPDGVSTMVANFADPTVGCVSSVDRFIDADGRVSGEGAYVRYEMFLRALETRVNSLVGLSGSFFAARREVCQRWSADRQSDFNTLLNAVELGLRGVLDVQSAGYYRNIADDRREFQRKIRTVVQRDLRARHQSENAQPASLRTAFVAAGEPQVVPMAGAVRDDRGARQQRRAGLAVAALFHDVPDAIRLLCSGPLRPRGRDSCAQDPDVSLPGESRRADGVGPVRSWRADCLLESLRTRQHPAPSQLPLSLSIEPTPAS